MANEIIEFGNWEGKPIKWNILKEDDFQMLLVSKKSLIYMQYANQDNSTWQSSNVRKYLNENFYYEAFSNSERLKIINALLPDVGNAKDNIFVLSYDEANSLLSSDSKRKNSLNIPQRNNNYTVLRTPNNYERITLIYREGYFTDGWASADWWVNPALYLKK